MSEAKTDGTRPVVLIVGSSFGGLGCATSLVSLGTTEQVEVIMVDSRDYFTIAGMWQFVWTGRNPMEDCLWKLADISPQLPKVSLTTKTTVSSLRLADNEVVLEGGKTVCYDYLVLSPGVVCDPSSVPGLGEHAVNLCSFDHVAVLAKRLESLLARAQEAKDKGETATALVTIAATPYKCPPLPFEIAFLVDEQLRNKGLRDSCRVVVAAPVEWPFGGPPAKQAFTAAMKEKNIEYLPAHVLEKVTDTAAHFADKDPVSYDLLCSTFPQIAPKFVADAIKVNPKGKVAINIATNQPTACEQKNVFVVGDAANAFMPAANKPQPSAGEIAFQMGQDTGKMIHARVTGGDAPAAGHRAGRCIAESGGGAAIVLNANFTQVLANPETGKPIMKCEPLEAPVGEAEKITWFNKYITLLFGEQARQFKSG